GDATGIHLRLQVLGQQETGTGAAVLPALEAVAILHATGVVLEKFARGDAEGQLPDTGVLHLAGKTHQLAAVVFTAGARQGFVPGHAVADDCRHIAQGFDVVDAGRLAPYADGGRERRRCARLGTAAFQRVDQGGFFPADIAAGAGVYAQLDIEVAAADVLAQEAGGLGFIDGAVEADRRIDIFAAQEDIAAVGLERAGTDDHAFDQQVRQL